MALSLPRLRLAALSFLFGAVRVLGGESLLGGLAIRLQLPSTKNAQAAPRFDASLSTAQSLSAFVGSDDAVAAA